MEHSYVDDLVELLIASRIHGGVWQSVAAQYAPSNISTPMLEAARKQQEQALHPLWNEYKKQRRLGNDPEVALRMLLSKLRS